MTDSAHCPLSIAQVSTADIAGGAERVALDLHREYLRLGHHAMLIVGRRYGGDQGVAEIPNERMRGPWTRMWNHLAPRPMSGRETLSPSQLVMRRACQVVGDPARALKVWRGYEDTDFPATAMIPDLAEVQPEVLHLHNLHGGYFDLRMLGRLAERVPLVVTAHDLWLVTGHCAQPVECERWQIGCGECPHLEYPPAVRADKTGENWTRKRDLYARPEVKMHLVAPSHWALSHLERSILAPATIDSRVIYNGVDQRVFRPGDKIEARAALGIPAHAKVVSFTVADARTPYKDQPTIAAALGQVAESLPRAPDGADLSPLVYLAIGVPRLNTAAPSGVRVVCLPFSPNPADVARALQASDVYVHAARAETLGLGILEAESCGVPVVVTRTGGAPEAVIEGETGFVVDQGDSAEMARRITSILLDFEMSERMGKAAATFARERFSVERMAEQYLELYREVIEKHVRA